jgi:hypothetical protein
MGNLGGNNKQNTCLFIGIVLSMNKKLIVVHVH